MSSNRKEMILEELDGLGPLKMTDAEKAQQTHHWYSEKLRERRKNYRSKR